MVCHWNENPAWWQQQSTSACQRGIRTIYNMSIAWVRFCQSLYTIWHTHNVRKLWTSEKGTLFVSFFFLLCVQYGFFSLSLCLWLKKLTNQRLSPLPRSSLPFFFSICTHNRQNTGSYIKIVNISLESAFCNRLDYTYTHTLCTKHIHAVFSQILGY